MAQYLRRKTASAAVMISGTASSSIDLCSYGFHRVSPVASIHGVRTRGPLAFTSRAFTTGDRARSMIIEASAKILDGSSVAKDIKDEIATEISKMKRSSGVVPGLAVILVGNRRDSATYVENKKIACDFVGINSYQVHLPEDSSEQEVLDYISEFNDDPSVNGILVQLPLPSHMNEQNVLNAVRIEKDVDGFNPLNIGLLAMMDREPLFIPCTPKGCIELLHRYGIAIEGKRAVVIGRSNIVGLPAALLLQREYATVTVVQPGTKNPEVIAREADILISAVGQPNMVRGSWIKPGSVVIDVGINPIKDDTSPRGYRMVGDICHEEASQIASAITPVPGGVGPMTIAMLLSNTVASAKRANQGFENQIRPGNAIKNLSTVRFETSCKTGGTKNW